MASGGNAMPVDYTYDPIRKIIDTDAHGVVTAKEIVQYLESILSDDRIVYGSTEVFSLENAADLVMQYSEVHIFQNLWPQYKKRIGQQILVIAPTKLSYGLFRMLISVVALNDETAGEAFKLFSSREALDQYLS